MFGLIQNFKHKPMNQINCISCENLISLESVFCFQCGVRVKCHVCDSLLLKGANFCSNCGAKAGINGSQKSGEKNTVKYRRTKDEVFCEVSLSDEVGKEGINGLIQNLTNNTYKQRLLQGSDGIDGSDEFIDADILEPSNQGIPVSDQIPRDIDKPANDTKTLPHIDDVEKNLTCTESKWILIYAFYISGFGIKTFSKKQVYEKYMSKRKTDTRVKNFTTYWKGLFKQYLETVKENEIKFKNDKLVELKELVLGQKSENTKGRKSKRVSKTKVVNENAQETSSNKATKKKGSGSSSYSFITTLNLMPKNKQGLKEFFSQYKSGKKIENTLKIVYYLEKILGEKGINENTIYTCFKSLSIPVPNIRQTLNNIHSRKGWINTSNFSDLKVNVAGENYIEHNMERK